METRLNSDYAVALGTSQELTTGSGQAVAREELDYNPFEEQSELDAEVSLEDLRKLMDDMDEVAQSFRRNLSFSVDEELGRTVVRVLDAETDELVREIPPEYMLELARNMERIRGILFDESA
ncbi:MAG: flagellar protein FlaG [Thiohalospira sp.]